MSNLVTVELPDIGDFGEVEIIEILVGENDVVNIEDSLITVESDKASMEIPSPYHGTVTRVMVEVGGKVSQGSPLLVVHVKDEVPAEKAKSDAENKAPQPAGTGTDLQADVVVLGAGPGGYTAAFRAADLGMQVVLIERYPILGGVCLNVGCIPSKALLHTAQILTETREMGAHGINFGEPEIDIDKLRGFKDKIVGQLTGGLKGLARQRKVTVVHGNGKFTSANTISVDDNGEISTVNFKYAIIAAGSQSIKIPGLPYEDSRLMDSTSALEITDIPERLLVIGGGIIGLEMAGGDLGCEIARSSVGRAYSAGLGRATLGGYPLGQMPLRRQESAGGSRWTQARCPAAGAGRHGSGQPNNARRTGTH